jgi:phospholipid/cholesterol/gamma-HCH transport system substrate-binding protein
MPREIKVGLLVLAALVVLAISIFLVGTKEHLFVPKNRYSIQFSTASGLNQGNPVQLNGVDVGTVERIMLPEDVSQEKLTVWVRVESRYGDRIREDSRAKIKTLGLLGDKYVDVTSGSSEAKVIPDGGEIPAAPATDVDRLIASGEDVVTNIVAISHTLNDILGRLDRGEGLLGLMTKESEQSRQARESLVDTISSVRDISKQVRSGRGSVGRLIYDDTLAGRLSVAVDRFDSVMRTLDEGEGLLPKLLHDPEMRDRAATLLQNVETLTGQLQTVSERLQGEEGLLPRMLNDKEYGAQVTDELESLIRNLNLVAGRVQAGDGTLGMLIQDPQIYHAVNDIIVGVNESKFLRWLIRHEQKKGIKKRYNDAAEEQTPGDATPQPN